MSPAFKEWSVIIEALGSGQQIVILRKGGIAEKLGGFSLDARRFWLFPTRFHVQPQKTKPAAAQWLSDIESLTSRAAEGAKSATSANATDSVTLRYFAEVVHHVFLEEWSAIAALDPHHFWTEEAVREKFEWDKPAGLFVFVVRVHRLADPLTLPLTPDMSGCKSWIEMPANFDALPSAPVLDDASFAKARAALGI